MSCKTEIPSCLSVRCMAVKAGVQWPSSSNLKGKAVIPTQGRLNIKYLVRDRHERNTIHFHKKSVLSKIYITARRAKSKKKNPNAIPTAN